MGVVGAIVNFVTSFTLRDIRHLKPIDDADGIEEQDGTYHPRRHNRTGYLEVSTQHDDGDIAEGVGVHVAPSVASLDSVADGERERTSSSSNIVEDVTAVDVLDEDEDPDMSCFSHLDAYLLATTMFALCGVGLMHINNVGSIIISLYPEGITSSHPDVQKNQKLH
ncbi:hypothetical protein HK102_007216, partial [Quaeritorhiza haematococci]